MRIAHVISTINPARGGPSVVTPRLAAAQASHGHDVCVMTTHSEKALSEFDKSLDHIPNHSAVNYRHLPRPVSPFGFPRSSNTDKAVHDAIRGYDFIHFHGVWEPLLYVTGVVAHKASIPYAIRPAGMLDKWTLEQKKWKKRLALATGRMNWINRAAFIHTLNQDEYNYIKNEFRPQCNLEVIPNGIFLDEIPPDVPGQPFRDENKAFLHDRPFVLFLSRLHHKKGLSYLANAFARVCEKDDKLLLVVAGPDEGDEAMFRQLIQELGIQDRVLVPGPIYGEAKYDALREANCFCLPSHQEGFSLAILETLGCGTPAVITPGCHFPEVESAGAGCVVDQDADAIAQAILQITEDPETRQRMSKAARGLVENHYTWPNIARKCVEAYQQHIVTHNGSKTS